MNAYATTEATAAAETRAAQAAARWLARPDRRLMFVLMTMVHEDADDYYGGWADRELARLADAAEAASR